METLCFATFVDILRPCLQEPNTQEIVVELLIQPIIDSDNILDKNGNTMLLDSSIISKWMTRKRDVTRAIRSALNKNSVINAVKDNFQNTIFTSFEIGKEAEFFDKISELINQDSTITTTKREKYTNTLGPKIDRVTDIFIHALQAENKTEDRGWLTNLYRGSIEDEVKMVLDKLAQDKRADIKKELKYTPTSFKKKIEEDNHELIDKVEYNVIYYYVIRDYFAELEGGNDATFEKIARRFRKHYEKLNKAGLSQDDIHDELTDMLVTKSGTTRTTCEKVVAFFIQDCEVYDEIT
jgi:hypothetical protein